MCLLDIDDVAARIAETARILRPGGSSASRSASARLLAFDRAGDLFIAGFNTKTLLMITARGVMTLPDGTDGFYPRGDGGLVTAPHGSVLAMNYQQIDRITPHGIQTIYTLPTHPRVGIKGFLPAGIAVAANGTIYLDTWPNGYANKTALIEIRPGGTVRVLWQNWPAGGP